MRSVTCKRTTKETDIQISLCLEGGKVEISTGIGFFDHMLSAFATHGGFGLIVKTKGDLEVDCHHCIEDTGIVLGKAFSEVLQEKAGIERFGSFYVPMDEALAFAAVDISGRPFLVFDASFQEERVGGFDSCMTEEFFRALAFQAGVTLHVKLLYGKNTHHGIEAIFKAVAQALKIAVAKTQDEKVLSTKGMLE